MPSDLDRAIHILQTNGIHAQKATYGFSISHPEGQDRDFLTCGLEHDGSTSISLHSNESPPILWFFVDNYAEAARFILTAYRTLPLLSSLDDLVEAFKRTDERYNPQTKE